MANSPTWKHTVIVPAGLAFNKLTTIAIVVAMIYFSREILAPLVKILQRGHLPRPLAVIFAVASALAVTISPTVMVMVQVNQLAKDLPRYQVTLSEKIHNLRDMLGPSVLFRDASSILKDLSKELEAPDSQQAASPPVN
jgi:predicted PurR-regulated permease PerM